MGIIISFGFQKESSSRKPTSFSSNYPLWRGEFVLKAPTGSYRPVDRDIFLSNKLVYGSGEDISVLWQSSYDTTVELFNPKTSAVLFKAKLDKHSGKDIIYNISGGLDLDGFGVELIANSDNLENQWYNINVKISSSGQTIRSIPIFIEPRRQDSDILFVESTDTFRAYNFVGNFWSYYNMPMSLGGVFYRANSQPADYQIINDSDKKYFEDIECKEHLMNADAYMKLHLNEMGFSFDSSSDSFLDNYSNIKGYRAIIFGNHNEYWTLSKIKSVMRFIDDGGRVLYLGGNNAWRNVERVEDGVFIWDDGMLKNKWNSDVDSISETETNALKTLFLNQYLGSYYDRRGYKTDAAYSARTQSGNIILFGQNSSLQHCANAVVGASGEETDKLFPGNKGFRVIAKGVNPSDGGAEIIHKLFPEGGGEVLNFGSMSLWPFIDDPTISRFIHQFLAGASLDAIVYQ